MLDRESPIASAVVEMRSGRVLSPSGAASAHEILELLGAIAPDVLGKQHSVALASLFERLAGADPAAEPQDEFREVMLISSRMAFVIQRAPGHPGRVLVSVHRADRRLGLLLSDARRYFADSERSLAIEVA